MEQTVTFAVGVPTWQAVRQLLADNGLSIQMRMIEGQLAFPDEEPPEPWRELRVGTKVGMVTLRRDGNRVETVVWGNADQGLQQLWNALTWGFAAVGQGLIQTATGPMDGDTYCKQADMPENLRR